MSMDVEYTRRAFVHFASMCRDTAPLYAELSTRITVEPWLLEIAAVSELHQPPPNLLFGAVHFLLLGEQSDDDLAQFYASLGGSRMPDEAWPAFEKFCRRNEQNIRHLVSTRRVQTNEVGRCGLLLPAVAMAHSLCNRPLHLIEIGASAGLNLLMDHYRYEYANGPTFGPRSEVTIRTELRGEAWPGFLKSMPPIHDRVGVDLHPVHLHDADAVRWLEALIWPDHVWRIALLRAARDLAIEHPPQVLLGDGLMMLPELIDVVEAEALPCVFHSHTTYQAGQAWREAFDAALDRAGSSRDLARVSLEWLGDDEGPQLALDVWIEGRRTHRHLASCHPHGLWMRAIGRAK